jgi:putative nucleotidyltransferase with HDIG domain
LSELRLELREPYPMYRSLRVPLWEDEEVINVRRVRKADVENLKKGLTELKGILASVNELANSCTECEKLQRLADTIALFYKAPLIQEVSPVAPTPLKANVMMLLLGDRAVLSEDELSKAIKDPFEFSKVITGKDFKELLKGLQVARLLDREVGELVYSLWIAFPADTRPGYNTSSLIAHLLLTSAITWALNYETDICKESITRLAALLHDIGKAVNPENHVIESLKIAEYLLGNILSPERLNEVKNLIEEHHRRGSTLKKADETASEADRLDSLIKDVLGPQIDSLEKLLSKRKDEWGFWKALYDNVEELKKKGLVLTEDPVKELSELFLREVDKRGIRTTTTPKEVPELKVLLIDIASIQEFVYRAQELKAIAAASSIVDLITQAHLPTYLRIKGVRIPPEAIVYSGGGNILMLVPAIMAHKIEQLIEEYKAEMTKHGIPLGIKHSVANFSSSYSYLNKTLGEGMALEKMTVKLYDDVKQVTNYNERMELCRLCYNDVAVEHVKTPEGMVPACKICKKLYELGVEEHFNSKWVAEINLAGNSFSARDAFKRDWGEVSKWIMEIISGHDPEELHTAVRGVSGGRSSQRVSEKPLKLRDYSVIKFDGNSIGSFMLEAISFTDAIERSFRIDVAIKKAYFRALETLYVSVRNKVGEERAKREAIRVFLGTIYIGGDDGLLVVPAWVSIPLAQFIAEEFARELGLSRGLTVAVTGGHARMNIWSLIDSSSELVGKAKKIARISSSALIFDLYEGTAPSGKEGVERVTRLSTKLKRNDELDVTRDASGVVESAQPYLTKLEDLAKKAVPEIWSILSIILNENLGNPPWTRKTLIDSYAKAVINAFFASRILSEEDLTYANQVKKMHEHLRSLRRVILSSVREVSRYKHSKELLYLYVNKQAKSSSDKMQEYYGRLLRLLNKNLFDQAGNFSVDGCTGLADLIVLIKFVRGGAW